MNTRGSWRTATASWFCILMGKALLHMAAASVLIPVFLSGWMAAAAEAHGYLYDPPGRSSVWRHKIPGAEINTDDNGLNCGGFDTQWNQNNGLCGICGDPYNGTRNNEPPSGKFAQGIVIRTYSAGQTVNVLLQITANHGGWFEFRLCPHEDPSTTVPRECLDKHLLANDRGTIRFRLERTRTVQKKLSFDLRLPEGVTCAYCVLQWKWNAAQHFGIAANGTGCLGCGKQEQYFNCADIAIVNTNSTKKTQSTLYIPTNKPWSSTAPPSATTESKLLSIFTKRTTTVARAINNTGIRIVKPGDTCPGMENPVPTCKALPIRKDKVHLDLLSWCQKNCNNIPQFCPELYCYCFCGSENL